MPVNDFKRKSDDGAMVHVPKKPRQELTAYQTLPVVPAAGGRTSNLFSPIMLLEGHEGDIFSLEFHPDGQYIASSGFDRKVYLWTVYDECENIAVMPGHTGAVMELHFNTDGSNLFTASTDKTLAMWDVSTCQRIRRYKGHTSFVNSVQCTRRGPQLLVSGSDDLVLRVWDARKRFATSQLNATYQVTAVTFNDTSDQIISGGIDNDIKVWDMRRNDIIYRLKGHTDTITGLSVSPDGSYLLSNSMDNTLKIWDIRPYAPQERCVKTLVGHQHNFEKNFLRCAWSMDGTKVSAGSADRFVHIWDVATRRILYKLPGHNGSVNDVDFHKFEPIIASGASDKKIYLGEIEP